MYFRLTVLQNIVSAIISSSFRIIFLVFVPICQVFAGYVVKMLPGISASRAKWHKD